MNTALDIYSYIVIGFAAFCYIFWFTLLAFATYLYYKA